MALTYIAPPANNPAQANDVFNDSELSVELAVEYRKAAKPGALVFHTNTPQELSQLLGALHTIKGGGNAQQPVPATLVDQNYVNAGGAPQGNFRARLQAKPDIEIIASTGNGYAVLSISDAGLAYNDPKGTAAPAQLSDPQRGLPAFWLGFYDKPGDAQAKQQLVQDNTHFHTTKQQPDDDKHSGFDWCLTNLGILSANVNVDATALRDAHKLNRADMVRDVNAARARNPANPPPLVYHNESKNERQKQARRRQLEGARTEHQYQHTSSVRIWERAEGRGPAALEDLRQDPQYAYVEVCRNSEPPEYKEGEGENINKFSTQRNDDYGQPTMKNEFELKEDDSTAIKSTGGHFTYEKRFLRMAEDLFASWADDNHAVHDVIVLSNIQPPGRERERECLAAFTKIFGPNRVRIEEAPEDRPAIDPYAIQGEHLRF